jgi:hypothetical protein
VVAGPVVFSRRPHPPPSIHPMRLLLVLLLFPVVFGGALAISLRLRRQPLGQALPLALAVLVAMLGFVLPAISEVGGITVPGLLLVLLPLAAAGLVGLRRGGSLRAVLADLYRRLAWTLRPRFAFLVLAPLGALALLAALRYPPNTWDSMTYHLARVEHWREGASVLLYETSIPRQNYFPPGAEYLLLVPQVLLGGDLLAPLVQLLCWGLLVLAAPGMARRFGAPRRLAPLATLAVGTLPLGVLEASSTQNDLVAAALAVAAVGAALPLLRRRGPRPADGVALGVALAAAWLVKPTALVAAAAFVAWAGAAALLRARRVGPGRLLRALGAAAIPATLVFLSELLRRFPDGFPVAFRGATGYTYPLVGEWSDRALHSIRALAHHLPLERAFAQLTPALVAARGTGLGFGPEPFRPDEDFAGNPVQAALFLAALVALALRWRRVSSRARAGTLCCLAGWVLLHGLARENAYFSRLELPLFALGVVALGTFPRPAIGAHWPRLVMVQLAGLMLFLAARAAVLNEIRPLTLAQPDQVAALYAKRPEIQPVDDAALATARRLGCTRVGLRLFQSDKYDDPWEYPLMRRALAEGIEVRQAWGGEDWPCLLVSIGYDPAPPKGGGRWQQVAKRVFARIP